MKFDLCFWHICMWSSLMSYNCSPVRDLQVESAKVNDHRWQGMDLHSALIKICIKKTINQISTFYSLFIFIKYQHINTENNKGYITSNNNYMHIHVCLLSKSHHGTYILIQVNNTQAYLTLCYPDIRIDRNLWYEWIF